MPRHPTPTALKVMQGNPGKRPLPKDEPKLECKIPRVPKYLSPVAKKHFRATAKLLKNAGVITEIDAEALALYCEHHATWIEAVKDVQENGAIVLTDKGYVQSQSFLIMMKTSEIMRKQMIEFGMTPSSRTKVSTAGSKSESTDPWSKKI